MLVGNYSGGLSFFKGLNTNFGVAETQLYSEIRVHPNPASEFVEVEFNPFNSELKSITLQDLAGRVLEGHQLKNNKTRLSLSAYPAGIYFLSIDLFDGAGILRTRSIQRIIVQHE
jgi:hypothetical protein